MDHTSDPWAAIRPLPPWRVQAACLDADPELFFPVGTTGPAIDQIEDAKTICQQCPVIQQCLDWALEHNEFGVWGGRSEEDRRGIKRRRQRQRAG
jgi:WhiB family transcriptional regulator, redox-sensing transcriptional regulator